MTGKRHVSVPDSLQRLIRDLREDSTGVVDRVISVLQRIDETRRRQMARVAQLEAILDALGVEHPEECSACGSTDITTTVTKLVRRHTCRACGFRWRLWIADSAHD